MNSSRAGGDGEGEDDSQKSMAYAMHLCCLFLNGSVAMRGPGRKTNERCGAPRDLLSSHSELGFTPGLFSSGQAGDPICGPVADGTLHTAPGGYRAWRYL